MGGIIVLFIYATSLEKFRPIPVKIPLELTLLLSLSPIIPIIYGKQDRATFSDIYDPLIVTTLVLLLAYLLIILFLVVD